jgi:hypothetical protein
LKELGIIHLLNNESKEENCLLNEPYLFLKLKVTIQVIIDILEKSILVGQHFKSVLLIELEGEIKSSEEQGMNEEV